VDVLANAHPQDVRLRLRAALRRIIDSIWLLVVPRGRDRLCVAKVRFTGGGQREVQGYLEPLSQDIIDGLLAGIEPTEEEIKAHQRRAAEAAGAGAGHQRRLKAGWRTGRCAGAAR
jgi:hypothetical protein